MADNKPLEFRGTGRRKTSVARVRLASGSGKIVVTGRSLENYFVTEALRTVITEPFVVTASGSKYDVHVLVTGGGPSGQAGAVRHGIARALVAADATFRPALKADGLLTRDSRMR